MATTTNVQNLKLNVLTQAQYSSATKETNEIYFVTESDYNSVISLPEVTTADNGKFLRVVGGAWAAVNLPNAEEASF